MNLSKLSSIVMGQYHGDDLNFKGISIDTRTLELDDLYIAIRGERFDGHDYIAQAKRQGAVAALVDHVVAVDFPQIIVSDTRVALAHIAAAHRDQFNLPIVGITGSCGKTTTRALLECILDRKYRALVTQRSFNNDIGVPLTLLQLDAAHEMAVIEMGANHVGEIAQLTRMVKPKIAILTCAAKAHLAGFGSLNNIAKAKGEIFQGLPTDGVAVINADDQFTDYWRGLVADYRVVSFGLENKADVMASDISFASNGCPVFLLQTPVGETEVSLSLMGMHNVKNALAATAAAVALGVDLSEIKYGLENAMAVSGRLVEQVGYAGARIIDDSYNANPTSVAAAIDILSKKTGESVLVFGDMLEMGEYAESLHAAVGEQALEKGLTHLYCYGPLSKHAANMFGDNAVHFDDRNHLIDALKPELSENTTVLVKGSNSMGMSAVVRALIV